MAIGGGSYSNKNLDGTRGTIFVHMSEGDIARKCTRCVYHKGNGNRKGYCNLKGRMCSGSSHCGDYKEKDKADSKKKDDDYYLPRAVHNKKAFEGFKIIPITDIGGKLKDSSIGEIKSLKYFYEKHGRFPHPIVIRCNGEHYEIVEGVSIYYAALEMKHETISVEMGDEELRFKWKKLRTKRTLIWDNTVSDAGEVIESDLKTTTIRFDNGVVRKLDVYVAAKSKSIQFL